MTEKEERNLPKMLGFLILIIPSLILRFGAEFIRFKSKANRAGRIFQEELVRQGLDKATAANLTSFYLEGSDLFKIAQSLR